MEKMLTVEAAAEQCCVTTWTIRRWVATGRLDHRRIGRRLLIPESALAALLEVR